MTTIVVDMRKRIVVADTKVIQKDPAGRVFSSWIVPTKIHQVNKHIITGAGNLDELLWFKEQLELDSDSDFSLSDYRAKGSDIIVISRDTQIVSLLGTDKRKYKEYTSYNFLTIGSGSQIAANRMWAGMSAQDSVVSTARLDKCTNDIITVTKY